MNVDEYKKNRMQKVVIFGSSSCAPDSVEYAVALRLGNALASAGIAVVSGGYSGTMEAVSQGASQIPGIDVRRIR